MHWAISSMGKASWKPRNLGFGARLHCMSRHKENAFEVLINRDFYK